MAEFLSVILESLDAKEDAKRTVAEIRRIEVIDMLADRLLDILESLQDERAANVLKCCTQSVIAKHIMDIKRQTRDNGLGFNSIPGTWICDVTVQSDGTVQVLHSKREIGRDLDFEIDWAVQLDLSAQGHVVDEQLLLREVDVSRCPEQQDRIIRDMKQLFGHTD